MLGKPFRILLAVIVVLLLWRMLSPAWRTEAHRSAKIAARVLLAGAAIALAAHFLH
ncbi:protein MIGRI [Jeongeupia chitinilytica]|uniref:Uncharacterized protein n=1 Tax=Jeongeupia chitinilytica TaxID=1041641 RepID=A0ABQ3H0X4_9NEIS|nr:hypothetical protein [Jeongeupia chitinilytica]GHD64787.1 hypothetical protein GCM10007350_24520 [Jeongeupia chitinilytica]